VNFFTFLRYPLRSSCNVVAMNNIQKAVKNSYEIERLDQQPEVTLMDRLISLVKAVAEFEPITWMGLVSITALSVVALSLWLHRKP
jgi:hypothetical protein